MRFSCGPTRAEVRHKKHEVRHKKHIEKWKRLDKWQEHFAWLPIHFGETCVWLEFVERRAYGYWRDMWFTHLGWEFRYDIAQQEPSQQENE